MYSKTIEIQNFIEVTTILFHLIIFVITIIFVKYLSVRHPNCVLLIVD